MRKTLTGCIFIRNAVEYGYPIRESIDSLLYTCDKVIVLDAGSNDGTVSMITSHLANKGIGVNYVFDIQKGRSSLVNSSKVDLILLDDKLWGMIEGKEKLSYFQNIALKYVETDYALLLQGDEILHEESKSWIYEALNEGSMGYHVRRINLWGTPDHELNVEEERMPCSSIVLRIAVRGALSYGDGESIEMYPVSDNYIDKINIIHYGFVRERRLMIPKIINMQKNVFCVEPDSKLSGMTIFNPYAWFSKEELKPIEISHSRFIESWVEERRKEYND